MLVKPNLRTALRGLYVAFALLVVISPAIVSQVIVRQQVNRSLADFVPFESDEILYWHQIASYRAAGLDSGYYALGEQPADAEFSHYYTYGPLFPAIYGIPARLVGWPVNASPYFNLTLFGLSLAVFIWVTRPNWIQLLLLGLTICSFWPLMRFLPMTYQEGFHYAVACLFATLFTWQIRKKQPLSLRQKIGFSLLIVFVSYARGITWALMLVPFLLFEGLRAERRWRATAAHLAAALAGVAFATWTFLPMTLKSTRLGNTLGLANLGYLWDKAMANYDRFELGLAMEVLQRKQIQFVIVAAAASLVVWLLVRRRLLKDLLFHPIGLGMLLSAILIFYDMHTMRDLRLMSSLLLLSLVLLIAFSRYWILAPLLWVNLTSYSDLTEVFPEANYAYPVARITAFEQQVAPHLRYEPEQENPWCNTLLLATTRLSPELCAVPGGIGLSRLGTSRPEQLKSRWILSPGYRRHQSDKQWAETLGLQVVADVGGTFGTLLRNPRADCSD